jgi:acyl carrier protein
MKPADDARLEAIFRAVFELPEAQDVSTVRQISEKKWDSLAHAMLVAAIESEFTLSIDIAEALEMTSFEATRLVIAEKLA